MAKTLERYQRCSYGSLETGQSSKENENSYQEYLKLKAKVDVLQRNQRNLLGEDLAELSTKELEQLEHQLDKSLRQIRSIKTQHMLDQLADLQRKEEMLLESNRALKAKLEESCATMRQQWEVEAAHNNNDNPTPYVRHSNEDFFEPLPCNNNSPPNGFNVVTQDHLNNATTSTHNDDHGFTPTWLL